MVTKTDPDTERGLYGKYRVERRHDPEGKHDECSYFVLDLHHDGHARNALAAYADSCEGEYPQLAADLRRMLSEDDPQWWCPACGHKSPIMPNAGIHSHVDSLGNEYDVEVVLVTEDEFGEMVEA